MSEATESGVRRTPWQFWLICTIAVIWNGFGGYDYIMSQTAGDGYLRTMGMTEPQIAFYHAMPTWMVADWAVGVWGGVLGAILLAMRSKWALHAFVTSLAAMLMSLVYNYLLTDGHTIMGQMGSIFCAVITTACVFFVWYALKATKQGLLR
jgi:hypothetical protein